MIFKVKNNSDFLRECVRKIRSKDISKQEKDLLKIQMNEKQIQFML